MASSFAAVRNHGTPGGGGGGGGGGTGGGGSASGTPGVNRSRSGTLTRAISVAVSGGGKRNRMASAAYLNNWGKVIFPIVLIVFTTLYFVLSVFSVRKK